MRESAVEKYLMDQVEKFGGLCWKWQSPRRGVPDRIVIHRGRISFVEVKAPGNVPTPQQLHVHEILRGYGAIVSVVDSAEAVDAFCQELML